jgi:rRNA maturation protein Nop10
MDNEDGYEPIKVDTGPFCGNDHWYMFYCPECGATLTLRCNCGRCGKKIKWPEPKTPQS